VVRLAHQLGDGGLTTRVELETGAVANNTAQDDDLIEDNSRNGAED